MCIRDRTNTPLFLEKVEAYYRELFRHVADLQITRGGPVIMMQVENEYGSFGNDKEYLRQIKSLMERFGAEVPFFHLGRRVGRGAGVGKPDRGRRARHCQFRLPFR